MDWGNSSQWGAAGMLAGSALQVYGQGQQARIRAQLAYQQAQVAQVQSALSLARGEQTLAAMDLGYSRLLGKQTAGFAKGGVVANTGSALEVRLQTQDLARQDMARVRYQSTLESKIYQMQSDSYRLSGNSVMNALPLQQASTLLGAYGTSAMLWRGTPKKPGSETPLTIDDSIEQTHG
jgi:hypothetical protein